MKIILCAVQPHLATAWRERIGADLSNCVRVVEGDILSLDVMAVVSPANGYGYMDGGLDALYTRFFGPQLQQRLQRMIREQANGELLVGQALLVETDYPPIPWCISAPTMRVPRVLETAEPAYLATRAAVRCALDAGLERVAIPGWGRGRDVSLPERPPLPWPGASAMLCIRQGSRRCWRRPVPSRRRYGS